MTEKHLFFYNDTLLFCLEYDSLTRLCPPTSIEVTKARFFFGYTSFVKLPGCFKTYAFGCAGNDYCFFHGKTAISKTNSPAPEIPAQG
jgi:hypothetical protein